MVDSKPETINEQVARKLGWNETVCGKPHAHYFWNGNPKEVCDCGNIYHSIPAYGTSIAAAWEILEKYGFVLSRTPTGYMCELATGGTDASSTRSEKASADTAPMAIALAFLKLHDTDHG